MESPGIASLVMFRKRCVMTLLSTKKNDNFMSENIKCLANVIQKESSKTENFNYHIKINYESIKDECSPTLLVFL